jgi:hypothetical protein
VNCPCVSSELCQISVSHPLTRVLCRLTREHFEGLSFTHSRKHLGCAGNVCLRFFGNNRLPMSLQWIRVCPLPRKGHFQIESTNPAFRHSETMVQDVVIEPLSSNGRPLIQIFRFLGSTPHYVTFSQVNKRGLLSALLLLVFPEPLSRPISERAHFICLANSLTLKIKAICSSETSVKVLSDYKASHPVMFNVK